MHSFAALEVLDATMLLWAISRALASGMLCEAGNDAS
jgi:hypothetical protein